MKQFDSGFQRPKTSPPRPPPGESHSPGFVNPPFFHPNMTKRKHDQNFLTLFCSFSMPSHSLNSSVGSKSSLGRKNLNLLLPNAAEDESTKSLHSSWIRRLRPTPSAPPPPTFHSRALVASSSSPPAPLRSGDPDRPPVVDCGHRNTISTGESRTRVSSSSIRSAFFRRLLSFCRERPEREGDGSRSLAGFGPFRVGTRRGLLLPPVGPSSIAPPPPWVRLPAVDSGGLDRDPSPNSDRIGGFGLLRQDSAGVLDRPNYVNCSNFREEEEEGREIGSRSSFLCRWIHGERNFTDTGAGSSSVLQKRASAPVDNHRRGELPMHLLAQDALNHQDFTRENRANSLVKSARDEYAFGELVGEAASLSLHPWHSGNGTRFFSSPRSPMLQHELNYKAHDRRLFEHHSSMDPWHGAVSNLNGSTYASGAARGGGGYRDILDDGAAYGAFLDPLLNHHNTVPRKQQRKAPAFPTEPDETFSYWNMGRHKRAKTVSSAFSSIYEEQK